jgi:hypothetical protein
MFQKLFDLDSSITIQQELLFMFEFDFQNMHL